MVVHVSRFIDKDTVELKDELYSLMELLGENTSFKTDPLLSVQGGITNQLYRWGNRY